MALAGVPLMLFGLMMIFLGGQTLLRRTCDPPSAACEASLAARGVLEALYSPGGLCFVAGAVVSVIGMVLLLRNRARNARRAASAGD